MKASAYKGSEARSSPTQRNHWRAGRESNQRPSGSKDERAPRSDAGLRVVAWQGPALSGTGDGNGTPAAPVEAIAHEVGHPLRLFLRRHLGPR